MPLSRGAALVLMPAVLAGSLLLANWLGRAGANRTAGDVAAVPASAVTVRLVVGAARVRAGQPIAASLSAFNHTNRTLAVPCSAGPWRAVVLTGPGLPAEGVAAPLACPGVPLPPGLSRFDVRVATTYPQCSPPGASAAVRGPRCGPGGALPPLAAGAYQLQVAAGALPAGSSVPPAVTVTLR